jgi:hypothetical protein
MEAVTYNKRRTDANSAPTQKNEVIRVWRKLHDEELSELPNDQVKEDRIGRACSIHWIE